jgi:RNA polymerase sigma-70 factor (ECF subfamily)
MRFNKNLFRTNAIALIKFLIMLYEETTLQNETVPCLTLLPPWNLSTTHYSDPGKRSDKLLWDAFKKGDELAFIKIYNSYANLLYQDGCRISSDKEMVRDCLQDFFLYLRKNRMGFGETNSIRFYLCKAFRRRVLEYLRKNNNEFNLNELFAFTQYPVELSSESNYINKQVKAEQIEKLNRGLKALDRKERAAIYYFYYKGLSYEQIAEIFNFSHVSSARRVMYRGIKRLRTYFNSLPVVQEKNRCKAFRFTTSPIVTD